MKILHCCLSCFYIDDYNYQENILPITNKNDGHEVKIIASTETFIDNSKLGYTKPGKYFTKEGIEVIRTPYKRYLPRILMKKIRHYSRVYNLIDQFSPDIILFHGVPAYELITIAKYKKKYPEVKFYVDSHEDFNNSATNFLSKHILHKIFYKYIIKRTLLYIDRVLCVGYESFEFLNQLYDIPVARMEFYPLGGIVFEDKLRKEKRDIKRSELKLQDDDILIVHSGKIDKKKRTEEILRAFKEIQDNKFKMIIIGSLAEDVKNTVEYLISLDDRVSFLGWKNGDELMEYLCASDLYIQPGGQSATMQNALCAGSAAALYPYESHKYLLKDSVFYIETIEDIVNMFKGISENREILEKKRIQSNKIAREILDYKVLASRLYKG